MKAKGGSFPVPLGDFLPSLMELKAGNVNDYMLAMRSLSAFMWLRLLGPLWPKWLDEADAAYVIKPFTNSFSEDAKGLAAYINFRYAAALREAKNAMDGESLYDFAFEMLERVVDGECLLCGLKGLPLEIRVKDWLATAAMETVMADAIRDADAVVATDDDGVWPVEEESYCTRILSAEELANDPVQAMSILSAYVWIGLFRHSWQSWSDCADMDRLILPFINTVEDKEVRASLSALYGEALSEVSLANVMGCLDQLDLQRDMFDRVERFGECLLCGGNYAAWRRRRRGR